MTRRDRLWRGIGAAFFGLACAIGIVPGLSDPDPLGLFGFALAMTGLVLMVQGRRVPATWKILRSRHHALPEAIVARRRGIRASPLRSPSPYATHRGA